MNKETIEEAAKKPPIGLMPKWRWDELRLEAIKEAIERFKENGREIPLEWGNEIKALSKEAEGKPKKKLEEELISLQSQCLETAENLRSQGMETSALCSEAMAQAYKTSLDIVSELTQKEESEQIKSYKKQISELQDKLCFERRRNNKPSVEDNRLKEAFETAVFVIAGHETRNPYEYRKCVEYWREKAGLPPKQ